MIGTVFNAPRRRAEVVLLVVWLASVAAAFSLDDPRRRFVAHTSALGVTTVCWLFLSTRRDPAPLTVILACMAGMAARLWAITLPPAFSEDVFRHVFEGRVMWDQGFFFPYHVAPADAWAAGVNPELLDEAWLRINHPDIATIYPPLAQATFAIGAGLGAALGAPLIGLKALLVLSEVALAALWARLTPRALVLLALCPLPVFEIAREGHADGLAALALGAGVIAFMKGRHKLGHLAFGLAALVKLNGLVALVASGRSYLRSIGWALMTLPLLALPYLLAGAGDDRGLYAYASRWRSGDGAFSLFVLGAEALLGGKWAHLGGLGITLTAQSLARGFTAIVFAAAAAFVLRRRADERTLATQVGALVLLLLLLSPTVHPWYALWLLPFLPCAGPLSAPMLALVALVPLNHHAAWLELSGQWRDLVWVRALIHLPVWVLLVWRRGAILQALGSVCSKKPS